MARFVYWPSGQQVEDHILSISAATQSLITNVAVAECGTDLTVKLITASGSDAPGSATLDETKRQGSIVPVILRNVRAGDQVLVLHKVTGNAWSTPLNIRAGSAAGSGVSPTSISYKQPGGFRVRLALFWINGATRLFNPSLLKHAEEMLNEHGFAMDCWPARSATAQTTVDFPDRLIEKSDHDFLVEKASDTLPGGVAGRYLPIFFGQFRYLAAGLTVFDTSSRCLKQPFCLVDPGAAGDNVTMLHEVGHASGLDHDKISTDPKNRSFMHEANTRTTMFKFQIDTLAKAFFVR